MSNLKTLKPYSEGQSGNPNGRPKGSISITSAIKAKLKEVNPKSQKQYLDELVEEIIKKAIKDRDFKMIREIWNHVDGSPRQAMRLEDNEGKALPIPIMSGLSVREYVEDSKPQSTA